MNKVNISTCRSRQKARERFQKRFKGKLRPDIVVHHKDQNPFNNDSVNLELMFRSQHSEMHFKAQMDEYWKQQYDEKLEPLLEQLKKEIIELNYFLDSTALP